MSAWHSVGGALYVSLVCLQLPLDIYTPSPNTINPYSLTLLLSKIVKELYLRETVLVREPPATKTKTS